MKPYLLIAALVATPGCRFGDPKPTYSEGVRSGVVEKFSRKGLLYKSWEGYIILDGYDKDQNGAMVARKFEFSVLPGDAPTVVPALEAASMANGRVSVWYRQDFLPHFIKYDTNYYVYRVETK